MRFSHSETIWREFPQLRPAVLVLDPVDSMNTTEKRLEDRIEPWLRRARERLEKGPEAEIPEIAAWRRAYSQMGLKPTKYRSAAEALLRRFKREGELPRLHPVIDLCNAMSLAFALPVAVFDLAEVDQFLEVRHAQGTETYLAWSGETERIPEGEVIFADRAGHAHARRWTFRQSRKSTVRPETRRALVVAEGLHPSADADVRALLDALDHELAGGSARQRTLLTAASPSMDF
jgi:DNA/RNA-binding domain of Phe-tRNA-synthetase-like protein